MVLWTLVLLGAYGLFVVDSLDGIASAADSLEAAEIALEAHDYRSHLSKQARRAKKRRDSEGGDGARQTGAAGGGGGAAAAAGDSPPDTTTTTTTTTAAAVEAAATEAEARAGLVRTVLRHGTRFATRRTYALLFFALPLAAELSRGVFIVGIGGGGLAGLDEIPEGAGGSDDSGGSGGAIIDDADPSAGTEPTPGLAAAVSVVYGCLFDRQQALQEALAELLAPRWPAFALLFAVCIHLGAGSELLRGGLIFFDDRFVASLDLRWHPADVVVGALFPSVRRHARRALRRKHQRRQGAAS